jgi:hypothetical protein
MTTRRWGWLLALWALLMLGGCVKLDQTLTLNADGSGTLAMRYGMSEQTIAQMRAMEQMAAQGGEGLSVKQENPLRFDPDQLRAELDKHRSAGVEVRALSSEVVDGWQYIDLEVAFVDIRALKRTELFKDSGLAIAPVGQGNYRVTQPGGGTAAPAGDAAAQQLFRQMPAMLAGLRIVQTIVAPGNIIETNAQRVDGRRASWVFDIAEDPGVLDRLAQTRMELTFDGDGVTLPTVSP